MYPAHFLSALLLVTSIGALVVDELKFFRTHECGGGYIQL
jgi:hypothetical protein